MKSYYKYENAKKEETDMALSLKVTLLNKTSVTYKDGITRHYRDKYIHQLGF